MNGPDDPRLSHLYRRAPQPEPDSNSDRIVMDAAHRAVSEGRGFGYRGWALAATLVLGVGIGWQLLQSPPDVTVFSSKPAAQSPKPPGVPARSVESAKVGIESGSSLHKRRESVADREHIFDGPVMQLGAPMAVDSDAEEMASGDLATPACSEFWLAQDQPREAWLEAIARARTAGETHLESCLQQGYRQLFLDRQP